MLYMADLLVTDFFQYVGKYRIMDFLLWSYCSMSLYCKGKYFHTSL